MEWEQLVRATQYCNKVCLEGLDCFLSNVLAMVVWWDQLKGHAVLLDGVLEFRRALVVKDMLLGFNSCCFKVVCQVLVGANHFAGCAIFIALTKIALLLSSTNIITCWLPRLDFLRKQLVWLVYILRRASSSSTQYMRMQISRSLIDRCVHSSSALCLLTRLSSYLGLRLVNCWPLLAFWAWPLIVSLDLEKCLATVLRVSPGHVVNCLFLTALYQAGLVRNPAVTCRHCTNSGCIFSLYTLKTASSGGGRTGRYLLGGCLMSIVSVLLLRTTGTSGILQRPLGSFGFWKDVTQNHLTN